MKGVFGRLGQDRRLASIWMPRGLADVWGGHGQRLA